MEEAKSSKILQYNGNLFSKLSLQLIEESNTQATFGNNIFLLKFKYNDSRFRSLYEVSFVFLVNDKEYKLWLVLDALFSFNKQREVYRQIVSTNGFLKICQEEQIGIIIEKYLLKELTSNNFSWLSILDQYPAKRIDAKDVIASISNIDEAIMIVKYFENVFVKLNYAIVSLTNHEIVFGNDKSQLKFVFENRYQMTFEEVFLVNSATNESFQTSELVNFLSSEDLFANTIKTITEDSNTRTKTVIEAYSYIIQDKLFDILDKNDFSWSNNYSNYLKQKYPWYQ